MDDLITPIYWLKEFSKSWAYIVSDEVVYCKQIFKEDSRRVRAQKKSWEQL